MFRLSFDPITGSYLVVLGLLAFLAICLIAMKPAGERLSDRGRRFLVLLRLVAVLLLFLAMLRPTLVFTKTQRLSSTLNLLIDQSESMSRTDEAGGNSRFHVVRESLIVAQPWLEKFQQHGEIQCFAFDAALHPLPVRNGLVEEMPDMPSGKETALGNALDEIRRRSAGKRVLGTILFSDGNQRTRPPRDILPHDAANRLRDAGMPLFAVRLGQPSGTPDIQDISVNDIQANDQVFVKNELLINGSVRISGYTNQPVPLRLFFEDEAGTLRFVEEKTLRATGNGQVVPYRFSFAPQHVGYFKYSVQVPAQPKELIDTNNQQSHFVRVIDGGLNVLFIQGEPLLEQGPLRQSLSASSDINIQYRSLRIGRTRSTQSGRNGSFSEHLERQTKARPSWVDEEFAPDRFNVYILDGIDSTAFKPEELEALARRVREGCGLILLGGIHAFGAGGYAETPLADVSPVELRAVDRQPLDGTVRRDIHWNEPIPMRPKDLGGGRIHYIMRLDANTAKNEEIWKSMPPLSGANRFDRLKPSAMLLAEGGNNEPLLVSHLHGLGRVLAFAGDSTYRWRLAGFVEQHKRFWRQTVLWLAKMEGVLEGDCWIDLDNVRLLPGETAQFKVYMRGIEGEEIRGFETKATVVKPDGSEESVILVDEDGIPTGSFRATEHPGDYTIRVEAFSTAIREGDGRRHAVARFMVFDRNLELDNPIAYPKLLDTISSVTEGRSLAPEQLSSLLEELYSSSCKLIEQRETKKTLYDTWPFLSLFVCVLGLEWFLRKRWGLV